MVALVKDIAAMLSNELGGYIVIGAHDNGTPAPGLTDRHVRMGNDVGVHPVHVLQQAGVDVVAIVPTNAGISDRYRRVETAAMRLRLRARPTSAAPGPSAVNVTSSSGGTWTGWFRSIRLIAW
ncbi:MAG: hypothetical protein QOC94_2903 [Actinoplanes sp.]|nr:hypothetical protein [Actinoplanes sp.]MDT5032732.1 hypothetical protein [Actinoplanes sp.]